MPASAVLPLTDRHPRAVLFRTPERTVDAAMFLTDATRLAGTLPDRAHVANLCQDRYWFALGLAAAVLRGQVSLLSGDLSVGMLRRLAQEFPDAYALTDSGIAQDELPLPRHRIDGASGPAGQGAGRADDIAMPSTPARQCAAIVLTSGTTGGPAGTRKCWGELVA